MKLKKISIITCCILLLIGFYSCQKDRSSEKQSNYDVQLVPENIAKSIAEHFSMKMLHENEAPTTREDDSTFIPDRAIASTHVVNDKYKNPALYIFNFYEQGGYVIISADLNHEPICAFADEGTVDMKDNLPGGFLIWLSKTVENIEIIRDKKYDNSKNAQPAWIDLANQPGLTLLKAEISKYLPLEAPPAPDDPCPGSYYSKVGPFLTTTWGQGCQYNALCPDKNCTQCGNKRPQTGCVATAMAQIIRYWAPTNNNFGYNYGSMPSRCTDATVNTEVQRLMRDAGQSVNMHYGCDASSASDDDVPAALRWTFGFQPMQFGTYYNDSYLTVKNNLQHHWPVLLQGCTTSDCHEWVCDGYLANGNNCYGYLFFHMNWGWDGMGMAFNGGGWFAFDNWNSYIGNSAYNYARTYTHEIRL
ncbi:MAG: C10 family peptidase [Ferruginibacter sp.]